MGKDKCLGVSLQGETSLIFFEYNILLRNKTMFQAGF